MSSASTPEAEVVMGTAAETATDVRPFQVEIPEEELAELRRRIEATRWPSEAGVINETNLVA